MRLFAPLFIVVAFALQALALTMLAVALSSLLYGTGNATDFLLSALICCCAGLCFLFTGLPYRTRHLFTRQMFIITAGTWFIVPVFAALPLLFATREISFTDALFETISGLTTTGSTVLVNLDTLPRDVLLWRSLLQWQGGVGIVCMAVALLPFLKVGGMRLFQTESSYWSDDNAPRAKHMIKSILKLYVLLTALCFASYTASGMTPFDAINHAFTTISTGGYSTSDSSLGAASRLTLWVAILFMLAGSIPFVLYLNLVHARFREFFTDIQIRGLLFVVSGTVIPVAIYLSVSNNEALFSAITRSAFNITSLITTTGFASEDYNAWGYFPVAVMFFVTFIGGCSGSTSGGTKIFRLQLFATLLRTQLKRAAHPRTVITSTYNGKPIKEEVISAIVAYFFVMIVCLFVITLGLSLTNLDLVTSLSGAATALMNVGPGLGDTIGPAGNFSSLADPAKWLLCGGMLLGRLEFLTILTLFSATFWRG